MKNILLLTIPGLLVLFSASAQADSILGTAASYAVLGGSAVTNTGPSVLNGNVGVSPGTSVTGLGTATVNGSIESGPGPAATAQMDAQSAYTALTKPGVSDNLTGTNLGGLILNPGVYFFSSSAQLTGALTLDFEGMSNENIVFQIGTTLTTASASSVEIINLGTDDNVYFAVGSSATLGTTTMFAGDILAEDSITLNTGADITCGSAIALTDAVTLDTNTITSCPADSGIPPTVTPEPGGLLLLGTALFGGAAILRRRLHI